MEAEFEEKEYEIPLNSQLLLGGSNIWTPGQVFEGNFGIDAAIQVLRNDFWDMVGYPSVLDGIILHHFRFGYLWKKLDRTRPLPTFKLNLFLQTKRPERLTRRTSTLRHLGLMSPYWRFEIKSHQQDLLNKLKMKLGNRVFVAYGCAAFDKLTDLYSHTENGTLVENSTFIKIEKLNLHHKWVYDKPGSEGFAMSEPKFIREENLFQEINSVSENFKVENDNPSDNLRVISKAIFEICEESNDSVIAKELLRRYNQNRDLISSNYLRAYMNIANFSNLTNCNWMVLK